MNKTININPDLFTLHSRGTRKKPKMLKEIKVKVPKEHNTTLSKRNILLKFIRRHQENNTKKLLDDTKNRNSTEPVYSGDFDESMKYLMNMTEELEKEEVSKTVTPNYTLKNQNKDDYHENVSLIFPGAERPLVPVELPIFHSNQNSPRITLNSPKYGCLKNGTLPTYRQFHGCQQTQKKVETISNDVGGSQREDVTKYSTDTLGNIDTSDSVMLKTKKHTSLHYPSEKRILRRTFRVGKSNKHRKVSILVSNRTIRHQIFNKNQLLKQTTLVEVKKYLVKHGLIKVGSIAPPDVLRKMYESASLMCGDVKNHNSEILWIIILMAMEEPDKRVYKIYTVIL